MEFSNKYSKDQLICKNFHANSSSEPQYNKENTIKTRIVDKSTSVVTFVSIWRVTNYVQKGKQVERYISHQDYSTHKRFYETKPKPLKTTDYRDGIDLFGKQNERHQQFTKCHDNHVFQVMEFVVSMNKCGRFKTLFTTIIAHLQLALNTDYFVAANGRRGFYELRQQYKRLKTTEMSETLLGTFDERYVHQF